MKHSTGKPTKAEQLRLDRIHAMPCYACTIEELAQPLRTEAHHIVDKGYRRLSGGHSATVPLCSWHHRGKLLYPHTAKEMHFLYGPSFARTKREFIARYGSERKILEKTDEHLEPRGAKVGDLTAEQIEHLRNI